MVETYLTPKLKEGETVDLSQFHPRQRTNIRFYGLENKDWTPLDVAEYKQAWMSQDPTGINIRTIDQEIAWCKKHLYMQDWQLKKHALPDDSHMIYFKYPEEAMLFKMAFYG